MIGILRARLWQKYRTMRYPAGPAPEMPERFAGLPVIKPDASDLDRKACCNVCPTDALTEADGRLCIDLGRCVFCKACQTATSSRAIEFSRNFRLASSKRESLCITSASTTYPEVRNDVIRKMFGRSLKLREVSAAGCNACEADTNVLNTLAWDLGRFGIQFVASPRHADGILVTGPVSKNMELALRKTYEAVAAPKIVIAVGACAISGGLFRTHAETCKGVTDLIPVDLFVPGCPPHPATILEGLLRLLGRVS